MSDAVHNAVLTTANGRTIIESTCIYILLIRKYYYWKSELIFFFISNYYNKTAVGGCLFKILSDKIV